MKKNFLRIIALNLAVLMLLSFPFCAFAEAPAELQVGENNIETNEYGQTVNAAFTADQDGMYGFYSYWDGVSIYDGDVLVDEIVVRSEGEVCWVYASAGKAYTIIATDDEIDGIHVDIYFTPMLPDGEFESGRYGFIPEESGYYSFFSLSWIKDLEADETPIGVQNGDVTLYYLEAGTPYEIEVWSNFTYDIQGTEDPFVELTLDGEENPAGFYKFKPETTGMYYYEVPLGIASWGDMEDYHSTLYAWETYYMYAEEPFTMVALPKPALQVGENNYVYPDGLEGNLQTFTPETTGWYSLYATPYGEGDTEWAIYNENDDLLAEAKDWEARYLYLTADTQYTLIFNYDSLVGVESFNIYYYAPLAGVQQEVESGAYAYTPDESGWYCFSNTSDLVINGSDESLYSERGVFELEVGNTYLFYAHDTFGITEVEFETPLIGDAENPAGYYEFTAAENATYYFSPCVSFLDGTDWIDSSDRGYQYALEAGKTYQFYAAEDFTMEEEIFTGVLKVGTNNIPEGDFDLTFTPDEDAWYKLNGWSSFGNMQLYVYDGDENVLDHQGCAALESGKTYNVETNAGEVGIHKYVPIALDEVVEEGYYVFVPAETGKYLTDDNNVYDPQAQEWLDSEMYEYILEQGKSYLIRMYDGESITKSDRVWLTLNLDGENAAGYYTFTPAKSGRYAFSCGLDSTNYLEYDEAEDAYIGLFYAGNEYRLYAEEAFTVELLPQNSALDLGYNQLFIDQPGTTEWTFTPEESGWYEFSLDGDYASMGVYEGEELIGEVEYWGDLYLNLTADTTYRLVYTVTDLEAYEEITIEQYKSLSGLPQEVEGGYYTYTPDESGYYFFGNEYSYGGISVYDLEQEVIDYYSPAIVKMEAGNTYLLYTDEWFNLSKIQPQIPKTDGTENPAGYYEITAQQATDYYFSSEVNFVKFVDYTGDEEVQYYLDSGVSYFFQAEEPFSIRTETFTGALKVGSNYIPEGDFDLTFTPDEDAWYKLNGWSSFGNMQLYVYDGDENVLDYQGYAALESEKTYNVETNADEVSIYKYVPIALDEVVEEGDYVFVPAETGKYLTDSNSVYDPEAQEWLDSGMYEYILEQGKSYLIRMYDGESITKSDRVWLTLNLDGENAAGYYKFTPTKSGHYAFDASIDGTFDYYYDEEIECYVASLYAGNEYMLYAEEDFTVEVVPQGPLVRGENVIFGEIDSDINLSFIPETSGWYAFNYQGGDSLKIYKGETLLKNSVNGDMIVLQLQADTEYDMIFRFSDQDISQKIYISVPSVLEQMTDIEFGSYLFTPEETGFYRIRGYFGGIYDIDAEAYCEQEMGAYALEAGTIYLISNLQGDIILEDERVVTPLTVNDSLKAAGYYSFVAPASAKYAFSTELDIAGEDYNYYGYDEDLGRYVYTFYKDQPLEFYADEDFYVSILPRENELGAFGSYEIFGEPGEEISLTFTPEADGWYSFGLCNHDSVMKIYQNGSLLKTLEEWGPICLQMEEGVTYDCVLKMDPNCDWDEVYISYYESITLVDGNDYYWYVSFVPSKSGEYILEELCDIYDVTAGAYIEHEGDAVQLTQGHTYLAEFYGYVTYLGVGEHTCVAGELIVDTPATCGKAGKGHKDCSLCGTRMESNITIKATGKHVAGALITDTAPTCAVAGKGHKNCSVCGALAEPNISIPATGKHTAGNWKSTIQPTYEAKGVDSKFCTVCNKLLETKEVAPLEKAAEVFKDVPEQKWYHEAVSYAYSNNLFKGVTETEFAPTQEMTRAMLVTVLWRYAGEPAGGSSSFSDVPAGKWYSQAVAWAASNGIVTGVDATHFDPNGIVTRAQMATILYRYSQGVGLDTSKTADFNAFPDGSSVKNWAKDGMKWAVAEGLITGSKNNDILYLAPANGATRGQVATILMRYIENIVEA